MPRRTPTALRILLALSFVAACGGDGGTEPEPPGALRVSILTVGLNPDPDGYVLLLDGELVRSPETLATVEIQNVPAGEHELVLEDVDGTCSLDRPLRRVAVPGGGEVEVTYRIPCLPTQAQGALVFNRTRADGQGQIVVLTSAGERLVVDDDATNRQPAWSPDGSRIAFDTDESGDHDLAIVNADGGDAIRLGEPGSDEFHPVWSPDGSLLLFSSSRLSGDLDLWVASAGGGFVQIVTDDPAEEARGDWMGN